MVVPLIRRVIIGAIIYEPDQNELDMAFDNISRSVKKYDAIIVDEGQDFRDIWWVLIEAALKDQEKGILYIFADDNQALLPQRAKYPVEVAPFSLSKNCRNSGKIYDVVARFHSQLPETSLLLYRIWGIYKASSFAVNFQSPLALAIMDAEEVGTPIIITTEPDPIENSLLNNFKFRLHTQRVPVARITYKRFK